MRTTYLAFAAALFLAMAPLTGCGDDGAGGSSGTGAGASGGGTGTAGGGGSTPGVADHLLLSEVEVSPGTAEFVEIWNPTSAPVDLSDYYLSDNSAYHALAAGEPWMPQGTAGTDFLVRFPAGTVLDPDATLVLTTTSAYESTFTKCADFSLLTLPVPCGAGAVTLMDEPVNGGLGTEEGAMLSNAAEMVVLFTWDGVVGNPVKDVDYVTWGLGAGNSERVDKTAVAGYAPDTAREAQKVALAPADDQSIQRCGPDLEVGETRSGGNGLTGHDETSEAMDASFSITTTPSPGAKNGCP